jgi:hypothetical protein
VVGDKSFINDWLSQEFKERVSKRRHVCLISKMTHAFKLMSVKVSKEQEEEEKSIIEQTTETPRASSVPYVSSLNTLFDQQAWKTAFERAFNHFGQPAFGHNVVFNTKDLANQAARAIAEAEMSKISAMNAHQQLQMAEEAHAKAKAANDMIANAQDHQRMVEQARAKAEVAKHMAANAEHKMKMAQEANARASEVNDMVAKAKEHMDYMTKLQKELPQFIAPPLKAKEKPVEKPKE